MVPTHLLLGLVGGFLIHDRSSRRAVLVVGTVASVAFGFVVGHALGAVLAAVNVVVGLVIGIGGRTGAAAVAAASRRAAA